MMKAVQKLVSALLLAWMPVGSQAAQVQDIGDYVVHFDALPTSFLDPAVAKNYRIVRSKQRAMVNITILKKARGTPGVPVAAKVTVSARNRSNQVKDIPVKEVREGEAVYYIGSVRLSNDEELTFTAEALPAGSNVPVRVRFRQAFHTN